MFVLLGAKAQMQYKTFKLDIGVAAGELTKHHAGFLTPYAELKVNLNNHLSSCGRFEYLYFSQTNQPIINSPGRNANTEYWNDLKSDGSLSSVLFTTDYNFTTNRLRPFVGAGLGLAYANLTEKNVFINSDEKFLALNLMLRTGISIDQIRLGLQYNYVPNDITSMNYLSLTLGFEIGGGKKHFIKP